MIRAVLFDVGGTLHTVQRDPELSRNFSALLLEKLSGAGISLPVDAGELTDLLAKNAEDYKRWSEGTLLELPNDQIWAEWYLRPFGLTRAQLAPVSEELSLLYDTVRVRNVPRPGMRETIEELSAMGLHQGIISNMISRTFVPRLLKDYGISSRMECVVLSSETGIRKPSPEIFEIAAAQIGIPLSDIAYVGDTLSRDVLGCRNAGAGLSIQIANPDMAHRDAACQGTGLAPDYLIHSLTAIPEIIRKTNQNG